jgi:hypothetical protein
MSKAPWHSAILRTSSWLAVSVATGAFGLVLAFVATVGVAALIVVVVQLS